MIEFDFNIAKNPRTKDIDAYIDLDVKLKDEWIVYTVTPGDIISQEAYTKFRKEKVSVAPGKDYSWNGKKWVPYTKERIEQLNSIALYDKTQEIKTLTSQIDALNDKIEFGMSVDVEADKDKLLSLRKERAMLM